MKKSTRLNQAKVNVVTEWKVLRIENNREILGLFQDGECIRERKGRRVTHCYSDLDLGRA